MKTAVIFTGGTIGSRSSDGFIRPYKESENTLLNLTDGGVEIFEPYFIHSEQLNGEYITKLVACVGDRLDEGFEAIIVTHGTDTLQYSAAALALAYGGSPIPIVLVSANYVLSDPRSNGTDNFRYAMKFITLGIGGVFVSYRNTGEKPKIFLGSTLLPHLPYSDSLAAIGGELGYFDNGEFIRLRTDTKTKGIGRFSLKKHSPVLWLKAHAGMSFPSAAGYKYVMIEGYHSGTLPTEDDSLADFCGNSSAEVYLTGMPKGERYECAEKYKELNIVVCSEESPIYMYIWLWHKAENEQ